MTQFYKTYKTLFEDQNLSSTEILALTLIFNRYESSLNNQQFKNNKGHFVIYTHEQLANDLHVSIRTISRIIKDLIQQSYITTQLSKNKHHSYIYLTVKSKNIIFGNDPDNNKQNKKQSEQQDKKNTPKSPTNYINNNNKYVYYNNSDKAQEFYQKLLNIGLTKQAINVLFNYFHSNISLIYHAIHLMINIKARYHLAFEDLLDLEVFLVINLPICTSENDFNNRFSQFCYQNLCLLVDQPIERVI